jgi:hypothetical protein
MTDTDVAGFKIAVQQASSHGEVLMQLPVDLAVSLAAEIEARTIAHRRLLEAAGSVLATVGKWRTGEIAAGAAMQAISAVVNAWDGGKS